MEVKIFNYPYNSKIGEYITSFVSQKRNAGYPYNSSARILRVFDEMVMENFYDETTITKEMIDFWIAYKPNEHPNGLLRRMTPVRQLSIYIKYFDDNCYVVPGHIPNKQIKYDPHIYTKEEIIAFFNVADNLKPSIYSPYKVYIAPVIFRLFFLCGMRHSEVLHLEMDDIYDDYKCLRIKESKSWKERKVYLSDELSGMLKEYDEIIKYIKIALNIKTHQKTYINEVFSWNETPYDILSLALYYKGLLPEAIYYLDLALDINPDNERLKNNKKIINEILNKGM